MRKLAPAFLLSSIVALSCGTAFALGDMNKNKKAPSATTTTDTTAPADARTNGAATPSDVGRAGVSSSAATPPAVRSGTPRVNETAAAGGMQKCQGIAATDPLYKAHNCAAMKGGPGASGGEGSGGSAGASGSSSSGSGQ